MTGVIDPDPRDETVTIGHAVSGYGGVSAAAGVTVTVSDPDAAAVRLDTGRLRVTEGESETYTVVPTAGLPTVTGRRGAATKAVAAVSPRPTFTRPTGAGRSR